MGSVLLIKTIKPKKRLDREHFRKTFYNAMRRIGTQVKKDFGKTTATWEHEVEFKESVSIGGPGPVLMVWTDDLIYRYVDQGTKPHEIWAGIYTGKSDKKALAFGSKFKAKTTPRVLGSGPGFSGGDVIFRPFVNHPGTEAREFSEMIQKSWEPKFKREMEATLRTAVKTSGYEVK